MSNVTKLPRRGDEPIPESDDTSSISDDELAQQFSERHGGEVIYVAPWDRWFIWDGRRFAHDQKRRVFDMARTLCRDVLAEQIKTTSMTETQQRALRNRLGSAVTIWAVVKLAGSDPRHAVAAEQLDADHWSLNTPAGIVDLRSGAVRKHDPAELHTKITAAAPGGDCPNFLATLERVQPDPAVRAYLKRVYGYGLTGSSEEHVVVFQHGGGRNGKGTITHAMRRAMGDYGLEIPAETLMESHNDRHPTELASLLGARLVVGSEVDTGRKWNESRLKRLTGGDPVSARYIGKDPFEFEPTWTLVIIGNSKPGLRQVDDAIRARVHLVEFGVTITEAEIDTTMPEKLKAEYGGILAWAIEGCRDWLAEGLQAPQSVRDSTSQYLAGEDMMAAWLQECTESGGQITLKAAHSSYREWCGQNGTPVLGRNSFGDGLVSRGYKRSMDRNKSPVFSGLQLVRDSERWSE